MTEIQIIKLVFGIMLSLGGLTLFIIAYKKGYKYLVQEHRCTAATHGTVIRTAAASCAPGVYLPVVRYQVGKKKYKVIGPEFRRIRSITKSSLWEHNDLLYMVDEEKQVLKLNRSENTILTIRENPMEELYPIGSTVTVCYDPHHPKLAYVERYCNKKWVFWLTALSGMCCFLLVLWIEIGL